MNRPALHPQIPGTAILGAFVFVLLFATGCSDGREVGAACEGDGDCADRCLTAFPGGMCTLSCRSDEDCTDDTVCADTEGGVCLFPCESSDECEERFGPGYACDDETSFDDEDIRVCEDSG